jgi:hypothetical protein
LPPRRSRRRADVISLEIAIIVAMLVVSRFIGFAGALIPLPAAHNLYLDRNPWYRFMIVALAITVPTAAQYTFCRKDELGSPSPIAIPPLMRLSNGSISPKCEPDGLQKRPRICAQGKRNDAEESVLREKLRRIRRKSFVTGFVGGSVVSKHPVRPLQGKRKEGRKRQVMKI